MGEGKFTYVFLGLFLIVLIIFFWFFIAFGFGAEESDSRIVLWSALTILVLLFGIIVISLFLNRSKKPL